MAGRNWKKKIYEDIIDLLMTNKEPVFQMQATEAKRQTYKLYSLCFR